MNKKNTVNEGISGVYPDLPLWKEAMGAVASAVFFLLPIIFEKIKLTLDKTTLVKYTKEILKRVKQDTSKDNPKVKIARAIQSIMHNPNGSVNAPVNYEQLVLNLLPNDLDNKSDKEIKNHIDLTREKLGLPPVKAIKL
jgi:hypothetical protein